MKKLLVSLIILTALVMAPEALAQETCVSTGPYGQGRVCGVRTPEKITVVDAGLADVSLKIIGIGLLISSAVLYKFRLKLSQ